MKKDLLFLLMTLMGLTIYAQEFPYDFSHFTDEYVELENPTSLTDNEVWDDPDLTIPLGFTFNYFGYAASNLYIDGDMSLGSMMNTSILKDFSTNILLPFEADLIDAGFSSGISESSINYEVVGESPDRICKIEWNNCAFYNEMDEYGTADDIVNFQLWIYEGTSDIEVRFGEMSIVYPELNLDGLNPLVGLAGNVSTSTDYIEHLGVLTGPHDGPTLTQFDSPDDIFESELIVGIPTEGQVYRFANTNVGVGENEEVQTFTEVYPSPFVNQIKVQTELTGDYKLFNLTGQEVKNGILDRKLIEIDTSELPTGIYILKLGDEINSSTHRLVKQ